jgi:hypothetical protein
VADAVDRRHAVLIGRRDCPCAPRPSGRRVQQLARLATEHRVLGAGAVLVGC